MVEKELKCICICSYKYGKKPLVCGQTYTVQKCYDGWYRVNGLALSEFDFKGLFDIVRE